MIPELDGILRSGNLIAVGAGFGAGLLNVLAAGGSLISYPVLLSFGFPPVLASVTNTAGLTAGSISGAVGHRRELRGETGGEGPPVRFYETVFLALIAWIGGSAGSFLLMMLPPSSFAHIVPWLLGGACIVIIADSQRAHIRKLADRWRRQHPSPVRDDQPTPVPAAQGRHVRPAPRRLWAWPGVLVAATYGGFFAAAQGVLYLGVLRVARPWGVQRTMAFRQILTSSSNAAATAIFAVMYQPEWRVAMLMAIGSLPGGWAGARIGRWVPAIVRQAIIVAVGAFATFQAAR